MPSISKAGVMNAPKEQLGIVSRKYVPQSPSSKPKSSTDKSGGNTNEYHHYDYNNYTFSKHMKKDFITLIIRKIFL